MTQTRKEGKEAIGSLQSNLKNYNRISIITIESQITMESHKFECNWIVTIKSQIGSYWVITIESQKNL